MSASSSSVVAAAAPAAADHVPRAVIMNRYRFATVPVASRNPKTLEQKEARIHYIFDYAQPGNAALASFVTTDGKDGQQPERRGVVLVTPNVPRLSLPGNNFYADAQSDLDWKKQHIQSVECWFRGCPVIKSEAEWRAHVKTHPSLIHNDDGHFYLDEERRRQQKTVWRFYFSDAERVRRREPGWGDPESGAMKKPPRRRRRNRNRRRAQPDSDSDQE